VWFNDIELPDELSRARDQGNLVIFAGAGVSRGPPSSLPLFTGLVERIAENAATPQESKESPDRFLGRLHHGGTRVHELAQTILLDPQSRPNPLHDLLLRLFGKPKAIRLVTTNFDRPAKPGGQTLFVNTTHQLSLEAIRFVESFTSMALHL